MSWHPLCLWHHIHCIWYHTHCVSDNTSAISDLKPILSAITSTVYIITRPLSKTSHHPCNISQVAYVCHHVHFTWHYIHTLRQQPFVFITSHALYSWHHMHYISRVIYCVWYHIHYMCDITLCLYLWHHTLYVYDISTIGHHTQCYDNTNIVQLHSHYVWHNTHCISVITSTVLMITHQLYLWDLICYVWLHHIHCIQQYIDYICSITATVSVSHTHCFHDITPFLSMILHPLYV